MEINYSELVLIAREIILEQHIAPSISEKEIVQYVQDGMYDINTQIGCMIDYSKDLVAKSLLKNYCLYARYKRLAEFNSIYQGEYVKLQFKYNRDTDL